MTNERRFIAFAVLATLFTSGLTLRASSFEQQATPNPSNPAVAQQPSQNAPQPPPFTAPNPPTPDAAHAPGQQTGPPQQVAPQAGSQTPLPRPDQSTVDLRGLPPLNPQPRTPAQPSADVLRAEESPTEPKAEGPPAPQTHLFGLVGAYRAPHVPMFRMSSPFELDSLVRDGKLYLSLHDTIVLAIQNNLDVEVSRYNLLAADYDLTRARGGGNLRGLDYTILESPQGVGSQTSPLLVTATTTGNASPTSVNVTDLSQVTQTGTSTQQNLNQNGTSTYSPGPNIPFFDPVVTGQAGFLRRSDQVSLIDLGASSSSVNSSAPLDFASAEFDYQQGFSSGAQLDAFADNAADVLYGAGSQFDPFKTPSTSVTLTQPLLRGRGRTVNLRFVRIAQLDRKASRLLFEQQLLETVYGVSRLYFDLVSLGENVGVKQEALTAAQKLYEDDKLQEEQGTLAPIELMRTQALLSSSRLDLIQAEGEYRQQEVILREQLVRDLGNPGAAYASIVPTDRIIVPDAEPKLDVPALISDALADRPDLAEAALQVQADEISARAARNNVKPQLSVFANVQTRGSFLAPYSNLGSQGTGIVTPPSALYEGGLRLSTVYQGGVQLNMPLRNRIAEADAARDAIQARQAQGRAAKLENDIRQQIENAAIAVDTAYQAYAAAVESSNYQQQLLQAEIDKFTVGESTNFLIVQDEAYLAQARSTEVAARSDWMKAQLALQRSQGVLLQENNIQLDGAIRTSVQ